MNPKDDFEGQLKAFYRRLRLDQPIDSDDALYVPLYHETHDPLAGIKKGIQWDS